MICTTQTICQVCEACTLQGVGVTLMNRVIGNDLAYITQSGLLSITYEVIDDQDGSVVEIGQIPIATSVFDTLQDGIAWEATDDLGYNFRWMLPGSATPNSERFYDLTITFVPPAGGLFKVAWRIWSQLAGGA